MMVETETGIWARADARVFQLLMSPDRSGRKALAANRTIANAHRRVESLGRQKASQAASQNRKADQEIEREFSQSSSPWGRSFRVRASKPKLSSDTRRSKPKIAASAPKKPRAYRKPLIDKRGRVALVFLTSYVGLKSKNWRPGLSADHAKYILREAALEEDGKPIISNFGATVDEVTAGWRALESVEIGYRANAKVQMRLIWNLPHELTTVQRRELVEDFCDREFGRLGLPFVAAIHSPDPNGDSRNFHAHICFSTRPCERTGYYQWDIASEKVAGLDDPQGLKRLRALAAASMNFACKKAGLENLYTHQTYRERGLDARRQEHAGPARMAAYRAGQSVDVIERNAATVERNEAVVAIQACAATADANDRLISALRQLDWVEQARLLNRKRRDATRTLLGGALQILETDTHKQTELAHLNKATVDKIRSTASITRRSSTSAGQRISSTTVAEVRAIAARISEQSSTISRSQNERRRKQVGQLLASIKSLRTPSQQARISMDGVKRIGVVRAIAEQAIATKSRLHIYRQNHEEALARQREIRRDLGGANYAPPKKVDVPDSAITISREEQADYAERMRRAELNEIYFEDWRLARHQRKPTAERRKLASRTLKTLDIPLDCAPLNAEWALLFEDARIHRQPAPQASEQAMSPGIRPPNPVDRGR